MSTLHVEIVLVPIREDNLTGSRTDPLAPAAEITPPAPIPKSPNDLIAGPYWSALTTIMPDNQPQTTPVWCNREGDDVLTSTLAGAVEA